MKFEMMRNEIFLKAKERFNSQVNSVEFEPPNLEINEEMYLEEMPVIEEATDSKGTYEKQPTSPLPNEVSMTEPLYDEQN